MAAAGTRSKTEVYMLVSTSTELTGSKLPSVRMVLGFFLHHHLELKVTVRQSSAATIDAISDFWHKARIPIRDRQNCQTKLERTFEEWRLLKKNKGRLSLTQQAREAEFTSNLDDLFDIAHANALDMMTIQEDKEFLLLQREKGRKGSMAGVDATLTAREKRAEERGKKIMVRRQKMEEAQRTENEKVTDIKQQFRK